MPRTSASPRPRPPSARSSGGATCENFSKSRGRKGAGMPIPVSRTSSSTREPTTTSVTSMRPPGGVYSAGVQQQIGHHLRQSRRVPHHGDGARRQVQRQRVVRAVDGRARRLDRLVHHVDDVDALLPQRQLVGRDAADVEQIVDQPHHMLQLAGDDLVGLGPGRGRQAVMLQNLDARADGRQRIAQLVGKRGQEFVLAPIGFAQPFLATLEFLVCFSQLARAIGDAGFEIREQLLALLMQALHAGRTAPQEQRHHQREQPPSPGPTTGRRPRRRRAPPAPGPAPSADANAATSSRGASTASACASRRRATACAEHDSTPALLVASSRIASAAMPGNRGSSISRVTSNDTATTASQLIASAAPAASRTRLAPHRPGQVNAPSPVPSSTKQTAVTADIRPA